MATSYGGGIRRVGDGAPFGVASATSSARTTRLGLRASTRAAASGARLASSRWSAATPSDSRRSASSARSSGSGTTGAGFHPSSSPHRYCPVPPATIGSLDPLFTSWIAFLDSYKKCPRLYSSSGSATSIRWWRTAARCSGGGLAVPMSMRRYTCRLSALTISPPSRLAMHMARPLLPTAVWPTMAMTGIFSDGAGMVTIGRSR